MRITHIPATNLNSSSANDLIANTLDAHQTITISLTNVMVRKTNGNVYHLLQYLELLQTQQDLMWLDSQGQWKWGIRRIEFETDVSKNVPHLQAARIQQLPEDIQSTLKYASCIGNRFDLVFLTKLVYRQHHTMASTMPVRDADAIPQSSAASDMTNVLIEKKLCLHLAQGVQQGLIEKY